MTNLRVLFIEDSESDMLLILRELQKGGYNVQWQRVEIVSDLQTALKEQVWDLIMCDFSLPSLSAPQALEIFQKSGLDIPFIIASGTIGEEAAVSALKAGAHDFLVKNKLARLLPAIERELKEVETRRARKQGEETIAQLAAIVESSDDAIIGLALNGNIVSWNSAAARLYGWSAEEVIGQPASLLYPRDQPEEIFKLIERVKQGEHIGHFETVRIRKNGQLVHVSVAISPVKNADGQLIALSSIGRDLTERQRATAALGQTPPIEIRKKRTQVFRELAIVIIVGFAIVQVLAYYFDLFDAFALLSMHEAFDELFFGLLILGISFAFFSYRQWRDADAELVRRQEAQEALRTLHSDLDMRVQERTSDLEKINLALQDEIVERKQGEEKIVRQINYLTALQDIDRTIAAAFDMQLSLNTLISKAVTLLKVDAASVLLLNHTENTLKFSTGDGFRTNAVMTSSIKVNKSYAGRAALKKSIVKIPNLKEEINNLFPTGFLDGEDFVSYYGVPLIVKGKTIGVMEVFQRSLIKRDQEWLDFLNALAGQAAIAISNAQLFDELQQSNNELIRSYDATIMGWSAALDLRDKETEGHSRRVTEMTVALSQRMGIDEAKVMHIRRGALLHDIGKLGIPDHILLKPGKLTDEEWMIMRKHPVYAYEMLLPITYLEPALNIPHAHHEKWDGTGYPRGLKAEEIPLEARIFAIVDVWDALTSDRPYRLAWSKEKTRESIGEQSGKHFDPKVVDAFLKMIAE